MKRATRVTASTLGLYAALLGIEHGYFEILQGGVAPDGFVINAIGPPCQAEAVWHACLPAMTVAPSFATAGVLSIVSSLIALVWAAALVERRRGGLVLIVLSLVMLLVGGGFVPTFAGIMAGIAGTRIEAPPTRLCACLPGSVLRWLARLWPWTLAALLLWLPSGWMLGRFFNAHMVSLGVVLFLSLDLGLPVLAVFAGCAHDLQRWVGSQQAC